MPVEVFDATATWECPSNVIEVLAQCWGTGASGALGNSGDGGYGGGGGAYAQKTVPVVPGNIYDISIPAPLVGTTVGDVYFGSASTVMAKSAPAAMAGPGGPGGSGAASVGDIKYSGGAGAAGDFDWGGGGGGSATPNGNGGNGGSGGTQNGGTGDGIGGTGTSGGQSGHGTSPGGGGAGQGPFSGSVGNGARGRVILTYEPQAVEEYAGSLRKIHIYRSLNVVDGFVQLPNDEPHGRTKVTVDEALTLVAGSRVKYLSSGQQVFELPEVHADEWYQTNPIDQLDT